MNLIKKLLFGLLLTGALFTTACGSDAKKSNGEACTASSECESNHCDATSKQCAAAPLVKKGDGEGCAASSECQSNNCDTSVTPHVCKTVKKANGDPCAAPAECQSNYCDTSVTPHVCKTAPGSVNAGGFCDETKDCATVPGGPTPACIDAEPGKKRCSAICTGAGQCPSPYACVPAKEESTKDVLACSLKPGKGSVKDGQPCSLESGADQECKTSGHVCDPVTHTCQAVASTKKADGAQCAAPTECQSNNCDMSATPHVCGAAKKADGAQCAAPAECQSNNCDTSVTPHVCKAAPPAPKAGGGPCTKDDECKSNSCDMSSHTCKAGPAEPCSATILCADMGTQQGVCLSTPIGDKCSLSCSAKSECAVLHAPIPLDCKDVTPVGGSSQVRACTL